MIETLRKLDDVLNEYSIQGIGHARLMSIIRKRVLFGFFVGLFEGVGWVYVFSLVAGEFGW